jgi:hypothetical protein
MLRCVDDDEMMKDISPSQTNFYGPLGVPTFWFRVLI